MTSVETQKQTSCVMQVMKGMQEGTLVDKDAAGAQERESVPRAASSSVPSPENGHDAVPDSRPENGNGAVPDVGREMAQAARAASRKLQAAPTEVHMAERLLHVGTNSKTTCGKKDMMLNLKS